MGERGHPLGAKVDLGAPGSGAQPHARRRRDPCRRPISPAALSAVAPDPSREPDQRSARWLLAVAGRLVREVGELITGASVAGKPLATLGIDSEVRFAAAKDRAAFAVELADAVNGLVAKYHDQAAPGGRAHRFVVALHPTITNSKEPQSRCGSTPTTKSTSSASIRKSTSSPSVAGHIRCRSGD